MDRRTFIVASAAAMAMYLELLDRYQVVATMVEVVGP